MVTTPIFSVSFKPITTIFLCLSKHNPKCTTLRYINEGQYYIFGTQDGLVQII